jgi:hypothetical protein
MNLIEELAARAFNATYSFINSSSGKRRLAYAIAYASYYVIKCALLMLYAFAIMVVFSATLLLCCPEIYYELAGMQWIPPIHHLFMFGIITSKETTCLRRIFNKLSRVFEGLPAGPIDPMPWIALLMLSLLLPMLLG